MSASISAKCRVCTCSIAATDVCYNMRQLPKLAHMFVICTSLSISEEERLPSELCQECHDQMEQLYAFRGRCIAADAQWRLQLENNNNSKHNMMVKDRETVGEAATEECSLKSVRRRRTRQQAKELGDTEILTAEQVKLEIFINKSETLPFSIFVVQAIDSQPQMRHL